MAHETIFRRWDKLRIWIADEREFLIWRDGLEAARRAWQATPLASQNDALLVGFALLQARRWDAKRAQDIPAADRSFIWHSRKELRQWRKIRAQAIVGLLTVVIAALLGAWWNQEWLIERFYAMANVHALSAAQEQALKPKDTFKRMHRLPRDGRRAGRSVLIMGSPTNEIGRHQNEGPQHVVTIAKPFAVSMFELTFTEWDACVAHGDCDANVGDNGWGRGQQPVINVGWQDAKTYLAWLSRITGEKYRLLTEAEYEYAARGGTQTTYPWGDDIKPSGKAMANCAGCGGQWEGKQPSPVGSFAPNQFSLYDMVGNVQEWVEDCNHGDYSNAPTDGSAWLVGDCLTRVTRGGGFEQIFQVINIRAGIAVQDPQNAPTVRSVLRLPLQPGTRSNGSGFRVARTIDTR